MNRLGVTRWAIGTGGVVSIALAAVGLVVAFDDPTRIRTDEVMHFVEGFGIPVEAVMAVGLVVPMVASAATGIFIFVRRPQDPLAMTFALMLVAMASFSTRGLTALASWRPALELPTLAVSVVGLSTFIYVFLVFPQGRLGRRGAAFWVISTLLLASNPESLESLISRRVASDMAVTDQLYVAGFALIFILLAVLQAYRYLHASSFERLQIKWVMLPIVGLGAYVSVAILLPSLFFELPPTWFGAALVGSIPLSLAFPICIARGVLKYRLYDIDLVVKRTILYAALTAMLAASYLGIVVTLQALFAPVTADSDLAVAGSTLAVAAMFGPLRSRSQRFIDQRFFRSRFDAQQTLERFSEHLRNDVDLDHLTGDLTRAVRETLQPTHISLWLKGAPS